MTHKTVLKTVNAQRRELILERKPNLKEGASKRTQIYTVLMTLKTI
jgi:hypothetical protein